MLWTEKDSKNLERVADALEKIAGISRAHNSNDKVHIEEITSEEIEQEIAAEEKKLAEKENSLMEENRGQHLWEETNILAEASEDYEPE